MYTGWYHFNSLEFVASSPGHHINAEFHAGWHFKEKRCRTVQVQFHSSILIHSQNVQTWENSKKSIMAYRWTKLNF